MRWAPVGRPADAVERVDLKLVEDEEERAHTARAGQLRRLLRIVARQVPPDAGVVEDADLHLVAQQRVTELEADAAGALGELLQTEADAQMRLEWNLVHEPDV